eukprot:scaffold19862_cov28-Tisochrysis_lutea.AAC.1
MIWVAKHELDAGRESRHEGAEWTPSVSRNDESSRSSRSKSACAEWSVATFDTKSACAEWSVVTFDTLPHKPPLRPRMPRLSRASVLLCKQLLLHANLDGACALMPMLVSSPVAPSVMKRPGEGFPSSSRASAIS